jgi:pimeloyl-ACP methyl ester carboxylesterase
VFHIHGRRDRVIPCKAVAPDVAISGAGHIVNLTHGAEVNANLARQIAQF